MAKVYAAPLPAPQWEHEPDVEFKDMLARHEERTQKYIDDVCDLARKRNPSNGPDATLVGRIVRFPIADGYAQYVVWSIKPLELVHLDAWDGYSIPDAHARGLRLSDVKALIKMEDSWKELMEQRRAS